MKEDFLAIPDEPAFKRSLLLKWGDTERSQKNALIVESTKKKRNPFGFIKGESRKGQESESHFNVGDILETTFPGFLLWRT